jgi:hypothetical protein
MCRICKDKYGSNHHQLYWFRYFILRLDFRKAFLSIYHLLDKNEYRTWFNNRYSSKKELLILNSLMCKKHKDNFLEEPDEYIDYLAELDALDYYNEYML